MRALILTVSLFAFGAASAWADVGTVACNATAGIAPLVRAEGAAERSGDVLIVCSGGTPATAGAAIPTINVQVFLNTNVSSRLMYSSGSATEALLLIDDPAPASQYLATQNPPFTGSVTAVGGGVYTPSAARPNVFAGNLMSASSVGFMGIPFDPPGASVPQRTLRLTNIRVNASQLGPGTSLVPSSVLMFITISGSSSLTLDNPQVTIGTVQTGMSFSVTAGAAAQCDPGIKTASLRFAETFSTAFLARGSGEQNVPGTLNNTESLFVNSSFGGVYANAGRATQGTHLIARFSGVPSGVSLYVPAGAGTTYLNDSSVATPVGNPLSGITAQGNTLALVAAGTSGSTADASGLVALTGGAGAAVYEVTTGSPGSIDTITIPVQIVYKATPAAALGTITASGSLAPIDPTATASFTAAAPRFVDTAQAVTLFSLSACSFSMSLNRSALAFAAVAGTDTLTPSQSVILSLSNASAQWVASSSQPWLSVSPASGSGSATLTIALVPASLPAGGTNSATITISAPQGGSNPIQIVCSLVMKPASAAPFGSFDTPVDNSTGLAGAIPVTGWALDDVAVERVALWPRPVPRRSAVSNPSSSWGKRVHGSRRPPRRRAPTARSIARCRATSKFLSTRRRRGVLARRLRFPMGRAAVARGGPARSVHWVIDRPTPGCLRARQSCGGTVQGFRPLIRRAARGIRRPIRRRAWEVRRLIRQAARGIRQTIRRRAWQIRWLIWRAVRGIRRFIRRRAWKYVGPSGGRRGVFGGSSDRGRGRLRFGARRACEVARTIVRPGRTAAGGGGGVRRRGVIACRPDGRGAAARV